MKRSERRLLEEKLRYVAMEDIQPDPEREQQMLEEVKANFLRQSTDAEKKSRRSRGHGIGRRVLIVSAAAVVLLVMSFGIAVLMPESVSHARGFVRTAAIWVNNTLKLGYEFEEPVENQAKPNVKDATYDSLEEAAQNIPYPLVYFDDSSLILESISVKGKAAFSKIIITYGDESEYCRIELTPAGEDALTDLSNNSQTLVSWQQGELSVWETDSAKCALTYYSNMEILITGLEIPYEDFLSLCQTLKVVNRPEHSLSL